MQGTPRFVCGKDRIDTDYIIQSLKTDIEFLTARIQFMENYHATNHSLLEAHRELLEKREAVARWLERESQDGAGDL